MKVRVGVIDSGVNAAHPHIVSVAGGVTIGGATPDEPYLDRLGHGTAVMAAIQEKSPDAEYFAVRVFTTALRTRIESLAQAIAWCLDEGMDVVNLSLGTTNLAHRPIFEPLIERAVEQQVMIVAPKDASGRPALPGALPGVLGVGLDDDCPREEFRYDGGTFLASGYPRPLPGMPVHRNLQGISFAVANFTGFVVRACAEHEARNPSAVLQHLMERAATLVKP